ncbi:superoxide dismutase [Cu-Zn] SodC [Halomonas sp. HP20-15]|uniref:superoxide dismutase [Cu-Zn] SodC n=1 Tax=Halomonas sp. HP20-15 TaxID=3085901 RepID=UPI00298288A6|nr:superoxide dismutase [Cu-Zn] SodC [Halomonas sp. HP20-15]MDW5378556.1 superoxide dismutase [Cu-Zn] SodC [Halomonas sp. HP20-15]
MSMIRQCTLGLGAALLLAGSAQAAEEQVPIHQVSSEGLGQKIGVVMLEDTEQGLLLTPELEELPPGSHGFHVHQNASCEPAMKDGEKTAAAAAGSHLDPENTGTHQGPNGEGHLGDLPALAVDDQGKATTPVLAPRLEVADLENHALIIHEGGDNYSDNPALGGGGARIACGTIGLNPDATPATGT